MAATCFGHGAGRTEGHARRIPHLGRSKVRRVATPADHQDPVVRQQGRGVPEASLPERARRAEGLGHGVEELGRVQRAGTPDAASDDEDAAVAQERGGVVVSSLSQRSNDAEGPARRIPELGRVEDAEPGRAHRRPGHDHRSGASRSGGGGAW